MNYSANFNRDRPYGLARAAKPRFGEEHAREVWRTLVRERRVIGAFGLVATLLALLGQITSGPTYTATSLLRPELREQIPVGKGIAGPNLDATLMLSTQIQIIRSQPVRPGVALQLVDVGKDAKPGPVAYVVDVVKQLLGWRRRSPEETAMAVIRGRLDVSYRPQSYLIEIGYTSSSREKAAEVANAVAAEYIRTERLRWFNDRVNSANAQLSNLAETFGDRHPRVVRAKAELNEARAQLNAEENDLKVPSAAELSVSGKIVPADPWLAVTHSWMRGIMMGLLTGLLLALALIMFKERARLLRALFPSFVGR